MFKSYFLPICFSYETEEQALQGGLMKMSLAPAHAKIMQLVLLHYPSRMTEQYSEENALVWHFA